MDAMTNAFLAGAAARDIRPTPEIVDNTLHCQMAVRFDAPGSPIQSKVLAVTFGRRSVILVALDLFILQEPHVASLRQAVAATTGLRVEDVVISCSHSHSTPLAEPLDGPHPYFELIQHASVGAAKEAWGARLPARIGHGRTFVAGASFNQRVPLPDGGVRFSRNFREGLASGRPVDPRLSVVRVDDAEGRPIAGWIRFAAHPGCVIFDAPVSGEYPGYLTEQLSATVAGGAPVLFSFGAAGDVNCVPMFGTEQDARNLGLKLAAQAAPVFETIETRTPERMCSSSCALQLPLDAVPSIDTLNREMEEVQAFIAALDVNPDLEWLLGFNLGEDWSVEKKKAYAAPMVEWAKRMERGIAAGETFPITWPVQVSAWIIDDLGLVFCSGETFTEIGLAIAVRSPLEETLAISHSNGATGYLGTDEDRRRGGYETNLWCRLWEPADHHRPLPYAVGAADVMIDGCLCLIDRLLANQKCSSETH